MITKGGHGGPGHRPLGTAGRAECVRSQPAKNMCTNRKNKYSAQPPRNSNTHYIITIHAVVFHLAPGCAPARVANLPHAIRVLYPAGVTLTGMWYTGTWYTGTVTVVSDGDHVTMMTIRRPAAVTSSPCRHRPAAVVVVGTRVVRLCIWCQ